jgi:hypothetical protein
MNEIESKALEEMLDALGSLYAHVGMVIRDETPHTSSCSWYANGEKKLIDRFAGYSLNREQALTVYRAMKTLIDGKTGG